MKMEKCVKENIYEMCPFVTAQNILAGKWTILILEELSHGKMRFSQLQKKIEITQTTLAKQLKKLESEGLVKRIVYPEIPPKVEYELTEIGCEFKPVLESIENWGVKYIEYLKREDKNE